MTLLCQKVEGVKSMLYYHAPGTTVHILVEEQRKYLEDS